MHSMRNVYKFATFIFTITGILDRFLPRDAT